MSGKEKAGEYDFFIALRKKSTNGQRTDVHVVRKILASIFTLVWVLEVTVIQVVKTRVAYAQFHRSTCITKIPCGKVVA